MSEDNKPTDTELLFRQAIAHPRVILLVLLLMGGNAGQAATLMATNMVKTSLGIPVDTVVEETEDGDASREREESLRACCNAVPAIAKNCNKNIDPDG